LAIMASNIKQKVNGISNSWQQHCGITAVTLLSEGAVAQQSKNLCNNQSAMIDTASRKVIGASNQWQQHHGIVTAASVKVLMATASRKVSDIGKQW